MSQMTTRSKQHELDAKAAAGETVVPGGTGGKSLEAQQRLAEGRSKGGQHRAEQLGSEGYSEMGTLGGLSSNGADGAQVAEDRGVEIDTSKFTNKETTE
ncbi:hypothetical protein R1sor_017017 [Riccia sorocarpa]|uniref:Uncharacterized protein n=1 Tax=Riccia sorocarpa TaxID=122646 RepID=A0ABD3I965_9MARC